MLTANYSTGHVLVLDADHGRKCHPWIVLAHEWEMENWEDMDIDYDQRLIYAEKRVMKNDSKAHGVLPLPNHHNRTPIARFEHYDKGKVEGKEKFVTHFGPDFSFDVVRKGKQRSDKRSKYGPDLAEIMDWYWDPDNNEEVCFTEAGNEYYRYYPVKGYSAPKVVPKAQNGNIMEDVSLESRTEQPNIGPPRPTPSHSSRHEQRTSTVY